MPQRADVERLLRQAEEHVALGERLLARQHLLVAELARDGHDAKAATATAELYEEIQEMHVAHRDRLRKQLAEFPHRATQSADKGQGEL